jgi:vacuolar-type H+-ATPase subunit F/Vma7
VGRVAVIGEAPLVAGFALAGGLVLEAGDAAAAREAWRSLPADVVVAVLTPMAAAAIGAPADASPPAAAPGTGAGAARPEAVLTVVTPP